METMQEDFERTVEKKNKKTLTYALVVLVIGLLLFSAVQTFQIGKMEKSVLSGAVAGNPAASGASAPRAAASVPAMVGGC